jgi:hypothetical protein
LLLHQPYAGLVFTDYFDPVEKAAEHIFVVALDSSLETVTGLAECVPL